MDRHLTLFSMPSSKIQHQQRILKITNDIELTLKEFKDLNPCFVDDTKITELYKNITTAPTEKMIDECDNDILVLEHIKKILKLEHKRRTVEHELERMDKKQKWKDQRRLEEEDMNDYIAEKRRKVYTNEPTIGPP